MKEELLFPALLLPFSRKTKEWRKKHLDWADSKTFFNYSLVRKSVIHKKINYDLLNGRLHMDDLALIINPESIKAGFIPENILHYPIMNSKLNVLRGEEASRVFDYRIVITNPNAITEIQEAKLQELLKGLQLIVENTSASDEEALQLLLELSDYYLYQWKDIREVRANELLNHYSKEYNMPLIFNLGFMDAMTVAEEMYLCDIVGGEPTIEKLNPMKVRVFKSGYSNRVEDADMIIIEDYWSPGKIIDTFYDVLTAKDIKYIENIPTEFGKASVDEFDNIDERQGFILNNMLDDTFNQPNGEFFWDPMNLVENYSNNLLPYDLAGNIRVLRVYWKSRRKIKKVKSYNLETGEEEFTFYPEDYVLNEEMGEEELILYINEAWEGTKIGEEIYVNMRPRPILYNRLSNPSRCHFGIIGSIYNLNESKPFSLVDMMKPYNYLYDTVHDKLNKLIAHNWGKLIKLDLAKVPSGWDIDKWMYYAKVNNIMVEDSFKEGNYGNATGKLAGGLNNASSGAVDASFGNEIQFYINLLEYIKGEMAEVCGISKQREGLVLNRETVGGVERATLQSSHITEWLFFTHDDVKKRAIECFIETAKIAMKGRSKKFLYINSENSLLIVDIDGDEFAECDYGLLVDTSKGALELALKMDMLALAALQNQLIDFSTIMKMYNSCSLAEKQRMVLASELRMLLQLLLAQQQQSLLQQLQIEALALSELAERDLKNEINIRDNETKMYIALLQAEGYAEMGLDVKEPIFDEKAKAELMEKMRLFDAKLEEQRSEHLLNLAETKRVNDANLSIKRQLARNKTTK